MLDISTCELVGTQLRKTSLESRPFFLEKCIETTHFWGNCLEQRKCGFKLTEIKFGACSRGIQSACQSMIGVYNHLLSKVFRFHYHSQKVIGWIPRGFSGLWFLFTKTINMCPSAHSDRPNQGPCFWGVPNC